MTHIVLSLESANRLAVLADFAMTVANITGNSAVKAQAIEAIAELLAKSREAQAQKPDNPTE